MIYLVVWTAVSAFQIYILRRSWLKLLTRAQNDLGKKGKTATQEREQRYGPYQQRKRKV